MAMAAVPSPATQAMRGFKDMQPLPDQRHFDAAESLLGRGDQAVVGGDWQDLTMLIA
jgi:hypothetical protein